MKSGFQLLTKAATSPSLRSPLPKSPITAKRIGCGSGGGRVAVGAGGLVGVGCGSSAGVEVEDGGGIKTGSGAVGVGEIGWIGSFTAPVAVAFGQVVNEPAPEDAVQAASRIAANTRTVTRI